MRLFLKCRKVLLLKVKHLKGHCQYDTDKVRAISDLLMAGNFQNQVVRILQDKVAIYRRF